MPWCEPCAKYFAPSTLSTKGSCPQCGDRIDVQKMSGRVTANELDLRTLAGIENGKAPWHFKLLVGLLIAYLGWRVVVIFV